MIYFVPQIFVLAFAGDGEAFLTVLAFRFLGEEISAGKCPANAPQGRASKRLSRVTLKLS